MIKGTQKPEIPSLSVVLPYFLLSSLSLLAISVLFFLSTSSLFTHYFHPLLLCITHIAVLGFITSIIFGSIYQMHYVVFEVNVYSNILAKISFLSLVTGIILLCISFYQFSLGTICQAGALLTLSSFILFAFNIYMAIRKSKSDFLEIDIITTSVIWLLATGIIGVLLVFNFTHVFIPKSHLEILTIHAHLGFAGWIILLIIGVSSRIIPMFYLVEKINKKPLNYSYILINTGLLLLSVTIYWDLPLTFRMVSSFLLSAGILFFLFFVLKAFLRRNRKRLDIGLNLTTISFLFLLATLPMGIILSTGILEAKTTITVSLLYGVTFIIGFCGTIIIGQTLQMIPFMLWVNKYQHLEEEIKTPMPKDLTLENLAKWMSFLFLGGVLTLCFSLISENSMGVRIASLLLTGSSLLFNYTIFRAIYSRYRKW
jgi:hypothetical protein